MRKILSIIKNWSAVIVLSAFICCMVCAFIACLVCDGRVYPIFGAVGVALIIAVDVYQLALEIKTRLGGNK